MYDNYSALQIKKGLERLRWAVVLSVVGSLVALAPVVTYLGAILTFVGFVLLVISWWNLGKSDLAHSDNYHNTALVLISLMVLGFLAGVIGMLLIVFSAASLITTSTSSSSLSQTAFLSAVLPDMIVLLIVISLMGLIGQLFNALSLRRLSRDLSQPDFMKSGNLYLISQGVSILSMVSLAVALESGAFRNALQSAATSGSSGQIGVYALMFTGNYIVLGIIFIVGTAVAMLGVYFAFVGTTKSLREQPRNAYSNLVPPPPPYPLSPAGSEGVPPPSSYYCRNCGRPITNPSTDRFCSACGERISTTLQK